MLLYVLCISDSVDMDMGFKLRVSLTSKVHFWHPPTLFSILTLPVYQAVLHYYCEQGVFWPTLWNPRVILVNTRIWLHTSRARGRAASSSSSQSRSRSRSSSSSSRSSYSSGSSRSYSRSRSRSSSSSSSGSADSDHLYRKIGARDAGKQGTLRGKMPGKTGHVMHKNYQNLCCNLISRVGNNFI